MIKHKKGFSLLEIILVLGIGAATAFMKFQDMKNDQETIIANAVGSQMKQMGEAVNRYISIRYDKLSTLSSSSSQTSDPGPRTCSGSICEITYQTLINEGLLPAGNKGVNTQKSSYKILLKRSGTSPNYVVNGLITTTLPWIEGSRVRYDLLGRAMQAAGIDSGMTQSATVASGSGGQWTENQNSYAGINAAGLLAYRVGYDSAMYSVYLRRDGTLPMTGDLNMDGNDINNVGDITASGTTTATTLKSTGATSVGTTLTVAGASSLKGPASLGSTLTVAGASTYTGVMTVNNNINATGTITAGGQIVGHNTAGDKFSIGSGNTNAYEFRLDAAKPLTIWRNGGEATEERLLVSGSQRNLGDLKIVASGSATGSITSSGNITSGGTVAGQYLQPTSTVVAGAACSPNGIISKDSTGKALSCVNGLWSTAEGGGEFGGHFIVSFFDGNASNTYHSSYCRVGNPKNNNVCSCPSGYTPRLSGAWDPSSQNYKYSSIICIK
ncbi:shufflon system plasmid conjugative transfer pilus tip adhesin PilV [Affinibrenneria salicis]|uniref:Shufflon system plasmid conjugative transfer pilus tip adhesin PilV n=1 Tax=Affinibrenneria salicis TaxID=2590031 RepID=A0A5J5G411_9GAMM|nr:shufflon system plasmid conjugative transfer pilus tip adhesin PilV [Affinibrenneria salicis]KAA9001652.1 shufflon system plasmid conjugative transfer pilus tip adhesin PilV [Affinibrenneria salicis]